MRDRHIQDTRIHCALFFINPSGHSLRAIDIVVLKKLSEVVNVVPIIAKSDSLTMEERFTFKQKASPPSYSRVRRVRIVIINIMQGDGINPVAFCVDSCRTHPPQHSPISLRY